MTLHLLSKLNDDTVVNNAVNGSSRSHGIFENFLPLRKHQIRGNDYAASFVSFCQQGKKHFHFLSRLLDVTNVIQDENIKSIQMAQLMFEQQVPFGP